ncbi:MAG: hypothetical protein IJQ23_04825 [Clostridia bacterium]|nr:hypothetical protein [Clostridia bacterium]
MNGFERVSYKPRVFERNFGDTVKSSLKAHFKKTRIRVVGAIPVKFYDVDGDLYVYCSNGTLYKITNNALVSTGFTSAVPPLVAPIIKDGVKTVLFISDVTAKVGNESVSGVPYGTSCAYFAGRLFIADGDKIKFSEEFDFTDFTVGLSFGGFIQVDKADGEILYLYGDGKTLSVVCEHAAYTVTPYGEEYDFKLEKISSFALDVKKDTVFGTGDRVCFISGDGLCVFTGGKIKRAGEAISSVTVSSFKSAGGKGGLYVLPFTSGNAAYLYVYDTVKERETLQAVTGYTAFNGYAVKASDTYLYEIAVKTEAETVAAEYSGEYDFGSCRRKSVCRIEAHIRGAADIVITGDGHFSATLTEKCNEVSCFVHGRSFSITFESASEDFKLYRLAVHYIVYGE